MAHTFNAFLRTAKGLRLIVVVYSAAPAQWDGPAYGDRIPDESEQLAWDAAALHDAHLLAIVELPSSGR
jgi:hypothetical protein